ncbi:TPA: carboxymuconolactone decarboxylase family protein [Legionella anisa]
MSFIQLSNHGTTPFERLLGHAPEILNQWGKLEVAFFQSKTFEADFLEQVRRALAFNNQCHYCMAKAGPPDKDPQGERLIEALRFANLFSITHESVDKNEITRLKNLFSEAEIAELIAFCSFISAAQKFGAALGLKAITNYIENSDNK